MTRLQPLIVLMVVLFCMGTADLVQAQHAKFVLFGDPNPAAAKVPRENRFEHPITSPYFHEDSFNTTDVRVWFLQHKFPQTNAIGGGDAQVYAAQIRVALTERFQLVAYKDGWTEFDSGLVDDGGFNDIAAGLKWNFLQDFENQFHAAVGIGYEIRSGDGKALQNDSEFRLWGSVNKGFGPLHLGGTFNYFSAGNRGSGLGNSDRMSWHLHADYYVCEWFSPVLELNGYHTLDNGGVVTPFSGVDVTNLGGKTSESVVTVGLGVAIRPRENMSLRVAYETPVSDGVDLFGYRWTLSAVLSF